jgi:pimeloyl-[acyl-carrier protein] synthase
MLQLLQRLMASPFWMRILGRLSVSLRLWHPDVKRDPYPTYEWFRERRIVRMRLFGGFAVARHADVERVLREPEFSTNRDEIALMKAARRSARGAPDFAALIDNNLLTIDGEKHRRLRGLVSKAFTPRRVESLRPGAEAIVTELVERMAKRDEVDLVAELAQPFPGLVIAELLGVPPADQPRFRAWSNDLAELLDPLSGHEGLAPPKRAMAELGAYLRELVTARRREPRGDLLTAMAEAEDQGESLSEAELVALASLLLVAGNETTTSLIGNAVLLLLRHPEERKRLQEDPSLLPSAVEECLRMEPPVQFTDRAVVAPVELAGVSLRPGTIVAALIAAANRDPEQFADPDRFDVGRSENRHLSFGLGSHFCLGSSLARMEAQVALGALLRHFPDFAGRPQPPAWKASVVLRGPASLPIRLR